MKSFDDPNACSNLLLPADMKNRKLEIPTGLGDGAMKAVRPQTQRSQLLHRSQLYRQLSGQQVLPHIQLCKGSVQPGQRHRKAATQLVFAQVQECQIRQLPQLGRDPGVLLPEIPLKRCILSGVDLSGVVARTLQAGGWFPTSFNALGLGRLKGPGIGRKARGHRMRSSATWDKDTP